MGKAAVIMWCRKKFFKYWRVLVPALLLAALCRPGPGPAAETGGGGSVTVPEEPPLVALTFDDGPKKDTPELLDALEAGRLCGAGIDAFSSEPPKDARWFTLDNVVLGSHCAASTAGASRNMGRMATANLIHDLGL